MQRKIMFDFKEPDGFICIDKPSGVTSHDIVNKIRKLYSTKKVGHTGTLDPMATGVLVVLVGRCAKAAEYLSCEDKRYLCHMKLGITTDTEDTSGTVLTKSDSLPSQAEVFRVCADFCGRIMQTPPMYSALKVNGKKLVDLARAGITVERESRPITVYSIVPEYISDDEYSLDVHCSKGTYIRTLCADIGSKLGCGGAMSYLRRTQSGIFTLKNSYTIEQIEQLPIDERASLLAPSSELFSDLPKLRLPDFYEKLYKNGLEIYLSKINADFSLNSRVALYDLNGFYSLGEVFAFPDGLALKSVKFFRLD